MTDGEEPLAYLGPRVDSIETCRPNDIAIAMLSSGTTGVPKRITLTYDNLAAAMDSWSSQAGQSLNADAQLRPALVWHPVGTSRAR